MDIPPPTGPDQVAAVARQVAAGTPTDPVTVRALLGWFNIQRRGGSDLAPVEQALRKAGLSTDPPFEHTHIDSTIRFVPAMDGSDPAPAGPEQSPEEQTRRAVLHRAAPLISRAIADPAFRVSRLAAAHRPPPTVSPDARLTEARTLMMLRGCSHVAVMQGERDVKGIVSWRSIGTRMALGDEPDRAVDCMERSHHEVPADELVFSVVRQVLQFDAVLVRQPNRRISGIVTAKDLSEELERVAEPFLLIGEIEHRIRQLLDGKFTLDALKSVIALDGRPPLESLDELSYGDYVRICQHPESWKRIGLPIDCRAFVKQLKQVNRIRNRAMHFDPDPLDPKDLDALERFAGFLRTAARVRR